MIGRRVRAVHVTAWARIHTFLLSPQALYPHGFAHLLLFYFSSRQFAAYENTTIIIWDLNEGAMKAVAREVEGIGARVFTYKVDVSKRERVYEVAKQMRKDVGKSVSVLVNNAGIVAGKPFLEGDDAYSLKTMEVNVIAHFWTIKAFLPAMVRPITGTSSPWRARRVWWEWTGWLTTARARRRPSLSTREFAPKCDA